MRAMNLTDERKRDTHVAFEPVSVKKETGFRTSDGGRVRTVRVIKSTYAANLDALRELSRQERQEIPDLLIESDPEIDFKYTGKISAKTKTVYIDDSGKISFNVRFQDVVYDVAGEEVARKPQESLPSNIRIDRPLSWTGKMIPIKAAVGKFVFSRIYQLHHVNGLTFDFLYEMAKELHEKRSFVLIGAGQGGKEPLRFSRGGPPYRAFLRGRVRDDAYCLSLHLTNLELKEIQ